MRIRPTALAIAIALVALGAQAQTAPQPARPAQEGPFSVFVYEKLGATPSLQRPRWTRAAPQAQPRAAGEIEAPAAVRVEQERRSGRAPGRVSYAVGRKPSVDR